MQFIWSQGTGAIPLALELQFNFIPVSGLSGVNSPTVEVYRASDDFVLDWVGGSFVPAPNANQFGLMSEVPSDKGLYRRTFNPADYGQNQSNQIYYTRYRAVIPSGFLSCIEKNINICITDFHLFTNFGSGTGGGGSSSPAGMSAEFCD